MRISLSSNDSNPQGDVIFLHGLGGSWDETWSHTKEDQAGFWPAWLSADLPHLAVHSLAYEASPLKWLGEGMPLEDRATKRPSHLRLESQTLASQTITLRHRPASWCRSGLTRTIQNSNV